MVGVDETHEFQVAMEQAEEAAVEHERLSARMAQAEQLLDTAARDETEARARLVDESADVARLESFSPTRIWAGLRGSREVDLDRERAEQQRAEYAAASAMSRTRAARAELDRLRVARHALGDPVVMRTRALAAKEEWLVRTGSLAGAALEGVASEVGHVRAEQREVDEALAAGAEARAALLEAAQLLISARGWSTYDTFFGGGVMGDMMKYDRMDKAQRLMGAADAALHRLSEELADVGMSPVGGLEVTQMARTFDVWFDNVFSDWQVRQRIEEAGERVQQAGGAVDRVIASLQSRRAELRQRSESLTARREELLGS